MPHTFFNFVRRAAKLAIKPFLVLVVSLMPMIAGASDLMLWYRQPARHALNEGLPIGNGHMGALILGAPDAERLVVDEDSLWTGDDAPTGDYDQMGAYQFVGDVLVNLPGHENATDYRRDLDIAQSLAHVSYTANGVHYRREYFCSHPAGVMVAQFSADKPASYSGSIELKDSHGGQVVVAGDGIIIRGALTNGLQYEWQLLVKAEGGSIEAKGSALQFKNCDALTFFIDAGTDYAMDSAKNFRGTAPHARLASELSAASGRTYSALKAEHIRDFQSLFNRVSLEIGSPTAAQSALPTDERKAAAAATFDPGMEELLFQYGRYLMISCSRPGGLPANLQGLWNDSNNPPWHSDYHANINIEMNYWPAEVANLSECQEPLFDLVDSQLPAWRKTSQVSKELKTPAGRLTTRGFAIRTSHNIFGGMGWKWDKTANAWYAQHFWEHYAFTGDKVFLKNVAYPYIKEVCEFWEDHLKTLPDGKLVVPNGWSPEHGPEEDGVSYNQEIVWDLFNNYVEASQVLGVDKEYREKIAAMRDKLATPGIGSWGQLLEWMTEKKDPKYPELDTPKDHHRHTSHLFAVYPGRQISFTKTPELAKAAKVSLDARGLVGDVREWSLAWRTALYARLHDGDSAHHTLQMMFAMRDARAHEAFTTPNLFGFHPPMQIDGDFGITAGIAEMLVQSHEGEINLLPALPETWPTGSVRGLRARGGFEVDIVWRDGRLTSATIRSANGGMAQVRYGDRVEKLKIEAGGSAEFGGFRSKL